MKTTLITLAIAFILLMIISLVALFVQNNTSDQIINLIILFNIAACLGSACVIGIDNPKFSN